MTAGAKAASTGEVSAPRPTSSVGYILTEIKRHRRGAAIITAALLAIAAGLAFAWYRFIGRPRTPPTATTPQLIPLTTFPGSEDSLSFSPDGNQVAFSWDGEKDGQHGYLRQADRRRSAAAADHQPGCR